MKTIAVLGLGRIGGLVADLLDEVGLEVIGIDTYVSGEAAYDRVELDVTDSDALKASLSKVDAVVSCLPFSFNMDVATIAHTLGIHYFDLTEDVATTNFIRDLAETSEGLMAPQCGLAPGLVGIIGSHFISSLDTCRSAKLRVGALPQNPNGLLGYSFNWSPAGVVNEYLNDCEVIESGVRKTVSSMEWREPYFIEGAELEACTTSGGLGTMCETFEESVDNLDYKTLRYPGHFRLMNFFFHELLLRNRRELAEEILSTAKPPVSDDYVYVHVAAEGMSDGRPVSYTHLTLPTTPYV